MRSKYLSSFGKGSFAGIISLGFLFVLRLGNVAPFPPDAALQAFLKIIPASVQEPSVQLMGGFAGKLGLIIASALAIGVYGLFGIVNEKWFTNLISDRLSELEKFLLFSLLPFFFFGLILLPASGVSIFGIASSFGSSAKNWLFPICLLFANAFFGLGLYWQYPHLPDNSQYRQTSTFNTRELAALPRRVFVEKGILAVGALVLLATGIDGFLTAQGGGASGSNRNGSSINRSNEPEIFKDQRLTSLVDSEITSNSSFYQVDIDIFSPSVDSSAWSLEVGGLVGNPKTYSLADLQNLPKKTEYNTFECISNNVNGGLISNAQWGGVKLADLFSDVGGVSTGAEYVVFYSVDGYSVAIPIAKAQMVESMVAYEMNSEVLPKNHGYPLRAVIPGLYGMMSAKWIRKIHIVNAPYMGYWQTRGWSEIGTVQTLAFITIPSNHTSQSLSNNGGTAVIGGYAYAGDRGISKVEVSLDGGRTWHEATLKPPISNDTWTLWAYRWTPTLTGTVDVYARATDGTGVVQTSVSTANFPNGATGYATAYVNITK